MTLTLSLLHHAFLLGISSFLSCAINLSVHASRWRHPPHSTNAFLTYLHSLEEKHSIHRPLQTPKHQTSLCPIQTHSLSTCVYTRSSFNMPGLCTHDDAEPSKEMLAIISMVRNAYLCAHTYGTMWLPCQLPRDDWDVFISHKLYCVRSMAEPRREVGIKQPARRVDSLRDLLLDTRHVEWCFQICASSPWPCPVSWAKVTLMLIPPVLGTLFSWPSLAVLSAHGSPSFRVWHSHTTGYRSAFQREADTQLNLEDTVLCEISQFKSHVLYSCHTRGP